MSKIGIYALLASATLVHWTAPAALAQQNGQAPAGPPRTDKSVAPIDITGYWVSQIVDE